MPRKPRLDTRNGIYHVMTKGNDGCLIFRELTDYSKFKYLLADAESKDPHILLAYCLMPGHIHLLMETAEVPLSKILHRLLLRYSLYFNKRYQRSGHLFQNRFKAKPCKQESYLLQLLVYIHDNPRKAGLVDDDTTYPYSSERIYQRKTATSSPVNNMRALGLIGPSPKAAWRAYHYHLLYTRNKQDESRDPARVRFDTEPSFFPDQEVYFESQPVPELAPSDDRFDFLTDVPLDQICAVVADVMGVEADAIKGKGKQGRISKARGAFICIARKAGWRPIDLMREFGYNPGTIAHHLHRYEEVFDLGDRKRVLAELKRLFESETKEDLRIKPHVFDF